MLVKGNRLLLVTLDPLQENDSVPCRLDSGKALAAGARDRLMEKTRPN